jgi:hypothetical protein
MDKQTIEDIERREAQAMLAGDAAKLESMWDDNLLCYSSANLYAGKETLLRMIRSGGLRLKEHVRHTLQVAFEGKEIAIAIGSESSVLNYGSGVTIVASYLNLWVRRADGWKLLARHVGRIARSF